MCYGSLCHYIGRAIAYGKLKKKYIEMKWCEKKANTSVQNAQDSTQ